MRVFVASLLILTVSAMTSSLPTSLVAEAQDAATKVKRVGEEVMLLGNQQSKPSAVNIFYSPISKRAVKNEEVLPSTMLTTEPPPEEEKDANKGLIAHMRRGATDSDENSKTVRQYEKGYLYGVGKEALDKKAENTLLKSEVYGEPVNEYRYYGGGDAHRQERVAPKKQSALSAVDVGSRLKRDLELDPESLLALISLWQAEHKANNYPSYRDRSDVPRYGYERQEEDDEAGDEEDLDNGQWLENPVPLSHYQYEVGNQYPVMNHYDPVESYPGMRNMYYPPLNRVEHKRGQWGGFAGSVPEKRFMVSKRRQFSQWEEPNVWSRLLATQPRDPFPGMVPRRRILL